MRLGASASSQCIEILGPPPSHPHKGHAAVANSACIQRATCRRERERESSQILLLDVLAFAEQLFDSGVLAVLLRSFGSIEGVFSALYGDSGVR